MREQYSEVSTNQKNDLFTSDRQREALGEHSGGFIVVGLSFYTSGSRLILTLTYTYYWYLHAASASPKLTDRCLASFPDSPSDVLRRLATAGWIWTGRHCQVKTDLMEWVTDSEQGWHGGETFSGRCSNSQLWRRAQSPPRSSKA